MGADENEKDIGQLFNAIRSSGSRFRFAPGVVGKGAMMWLGLISVWALILWRISPTAFVFDAILVGVGVALTAAVMRETGKMRTYAKENPVPAMLEGADIVAYKAIEASAKGSVGVDRSPATSAPGMDVTRVVNPERADS